MAQTLSVTPILVRQGRLQENVSPFIASFTGRGLHREVVFHTLIETQAADPSPLCRRILTAFQRSLGDQGRASLTLALTRALQAAHQELREANAKQPLANRVGAGMTCLAVREADVYIAQVEPGVLCLRDSLGVRTLQPPYAQGAPPPEATEGGYRLGTDAGEAPVKLGQHTLARGQKLLAAHSSLTLATSYDNLIGILSSAPPEAAAKLGRLMERDPFFAALLVSFSGAS